MKLSAVGDVVHTLPALNALREKYPRAHIGWVVHPAAANLLEGHPQLDDLIRLPRRVRFFRDWTSMRKVLRKLAGDRGQWDCAIDFQGLTKSGIVAWLSRAKQRVGFSGPASRELNSLFMNERVRPASTSVIKMNMELLGPLGIAADTPPRAVLHVTESDRQYIRHWAGQQGVAQERFLIVDPFAGWESKLWEVNNWIELAARAHNKFGVRPLIFFGPGERDRAEALASKIPSQVRAMIAPDTSLREYIALLQTQARAFVGSDTGPMHIAAAAGVPVVALYGPSDSRRNAPAFEGARFETLQDFSQPCAGSFARKRRYHAPGRCMCTLTPEMVLGCLEKLL